MALLDTIQWFIPTYVGYTAAYRDSRRPRRFIPTYVGHTAPSSSISLVSTVHPHIRGAYFCTKGTTFIFHGSSPHTWGIRFPALGLPGNNRFIPTYVGHTTWRGPRCPWRSVHPHIRGAYCDLNAVNDTQNGSSPHTWGIRFIPAHIPGTVSVHPHLRGAYRNTTSSRTSGTGSSPPTWGIPEDPGLSHRQHRFIPTHVGHTQASVLKPSI